MLTQFRFFAFLLLSSFFFESSYGAPPPSDTHIFNWNITWKTVNPTGQKERQVISINDQWPLPTIEVNKGDRIIVNAYNGLGDHNTSLHFHGMYQNGTNYMDGPSRVTQCPIPPGATFTYNFVANQNGTHWYHSHVRGQYPDGYRAPFIIHDRDAYFANDYQEELIFTLSDWYDEVVDVLEKKFMNIYNPSGSEPVPNHLLFNESQNVSVPIKPNTAYLLHVMNIGALGSTYFWIEGHNLTIVEVDGVYTEKVTVDKLYITPAQRYTVILTTKSKTDKNYGIVTVFDQTMFDDIPADLKLNQTNWLEYNSSASHNEVKLAYKSSEEISAFDDFYLIPADRKELYRDPDVEITLNISMTNLMDGVNYAFFNDITYIPGKVPTLYTIMSAPEELLYDPTIYGINTNPHILKHMQVVQIVINNNDAGIHPFHLHGHEFQVVSRSVGYESYNYTPYNSSLSNREAESVMSMIPMRRDTAHVLPNGNMVIRFVANNPGVWIFHCHLEWHLEQGLAMLFIEAPKEIRERQVIPQSHYDMCISSNFPIVGNAAGNVEDYLNMTGQRRQEPSLPLGFTVRGLAAMIFSCVAAFMGMFVIAFYGLFDFSISPFNTEDDMGSEDFDDDFNDNSNGDDDDDDEYDDGTPGSTTMHTQDTLQLTMEPPRKWVITNPETFGDDKEKDDQHLQDIDDYLDKRER